MIPLSHQDKSFIKHARLSCIQMPQAIPCPPLLPRLCLLIKSLFNHLLFVQGVPFVCVLFFLMNLDPSLPLGFY